jgi:adenylosuccinate synthase
VIRVADAYRTAAHGDPVRRFPVMDVDSCSPVWREIPGWSEDITACRTFESLPPACREYIAILEDLVGIPASVLSVGPGRDQVIRR